MSITRDERETYETAWSIPGYSDHSPGVQFLPIFLQMRRALTDRAPSDETVLDAGTGSGKGALALQAAGFRVSMCDVTAAGLVPEAHDLPFTEVCLWRDVLAECGEYDWVYCCDVLEHLPPVFASLVVYHLLRCARSGVFFSISLVPDVFGRWVGKPLHQTVLSYRVWRDTFTELGTVIEARDLGQTGLYLVTR